MISRKVVCCNSVLTNLREEEKHSGYLLSWENPCPPSKGDGSPLSFGEQGNYEQIPSTEYH